MTLLNPQCGKNLNKKGTHDVEVSCMCPARNKARHTAFLSDAAQDSVSMTRAQMEGPMDKQDFEKALLDVSKAFATPEDICHHPDLTRQQKLKLLQQWEYDLQLLLVAAEENMPSQGRTSEPGNTAELVRQIHKLVAQMGAEADPEKSGPAKAGGIDVPEKPASQKARAAS
jgi:hypothetical protein